MAQDLDNGKVASHQGTAGKDQKALTGTGKSLESGSFVHVIRRRHRIVKIHFIELLQHHRHVFRLTVKKYFEEQSRGDGLLSALLDQHGQMPNMMLLHNLLFLVHELSWILFVSTVPALGVVRLTPSPMSITRLPRPIRGRVIGVRAASLWKARGLPWIKARKLD